MKTRFFLALGAVVSLILCDDLSARQRLEQNEYAQTIVCESPNNGCDEKLIEAIEGSHSYIRFAIYTMTKANIADALIAAKLRGLDVQGIMDFKQSDIPEEKPIITKMKKYGIKLKIPEKESGLIHIKMLVTDNAYALGSFNWTASAVSYNDEVLEIGKVEALRRKYLSIWDKLNKKYK